MVGWRSSWCSWCQNCLVCQCTPLNGFILFSRSMTLHTAEYSTNPEDENDPCTKPVYRDARSDAVLKNANRAMTEAQSDNSDSDDVILVRSSNSRPRYLDINDLDAVCGEFLDEDAGCVPSKEEETRRAPSSSSEVSTARKRSSKNSRRKKTDFGSPAAMTERMEPMYAVERIVSHRIYRASILDDGIVMIE